jgi:pyruvate-ferredoxin/flavodoxin oxidoreductase
LEARIPFIHFFDGFRTSHEIAKIEQLNGDDLRAMISAELMHAHRARGLSPDHPVLRGSAQNPDVYFQARESVNPYYAACPAIVQGAMDRFAALTGRAYHLFDYAGAPDAERVIVIMGSGAETARETAAALAARGERVGVLTVRLFRPFAVEHFLRVLPASAKSIAVLDRTKEPGSAGEPLYLDVVAALAQGCATARPRVIGGRYGLSSKEFTPAMVKGVFDELAADTPRTHITVGIQDDVTHTSVAYDPAFSIEPDDTVRCVFWGLGSDGTVGANKNSIKIIGEETPLHAQGYFVYDSKKSGSLTVSHLRFGPQPIHAPYLISQAHFIACHQFSLLERFDVLAQALPGATVLLDSTYGPDDVWRHLPIEARETIEQRHLRLYVIDAQRLAREAGMAGRVNTVMQTCFFAISGVLPREQAVEAIKRSITKTYGKRGETVVQRNHAVVDQALTHLTEVNVAAASARLGANGANVRRRPPVPAAAAAFVQKVLSPMIAGQGDDLPVSALPVDGTYPTGTAQWEKRNVGLEMPVWDPDLCIQCGKCVFVCPHAVIREKIFDPAALQGAPETFASADSRFKEFPGMRYTLQVSPEDCTGCGLCVEACPVKDKTQVRRRAVNMAEQPPLRQRESANWEFFQTLPEMDRRMLNLGAVKDSQLLQPLFEFSGACSGCGETPYIKLATQLFGDRMIVANATGCSSIYGGNLPTTPWTCNAAGRGPAWSNSLFEDNAEFGLGMRLTLDKQAEYATELLAALAPRLGTARITALIEAEQTTEADIAAQRERVADLKSVLVALAEEGDPMIARQARELTSVADSLVRRTVWIIGGDGWAYDIGFGGLDHVLASGRNVNILVMDTEVYSNTGGQASKSTPRAAVAKFASRGKGTAKKDLGLLAMAYGTVYVARVAMGASDQQTLYAFREAEAYDGPSLIIAYSHCIAHGIDIRQGLNQQRLAVQTGYWPLYRYNPDLAASGQNPLTLDSKPPNIPLEAFMYNEMRFRMLVQSDEARAGALLEQARHDVSTRWDAYERLATAAPPNDANGHAQ